MGLYVLYYFYMAHPSNIKTKEAITLPKSEYLRLKNQAQAYRTLASQVFAMPLEDSVEGVVADFKATDLYTKDLLTDLEDGLRKSSYGKRYANQTTKK